jgi:hypothetical protein
VDCAYGENTLRNRDFFTVETSTSHLESNFNSDKTQFLKIKEYR